MATVGWPDTRSAASIVTQGRRCRSALSHPLNRVGCGRNEINDPYHSNKYVRKLRCVSGERTAALSEFELSMWLPDSHPDALRLQQPLGAASNTSGKLWFRAAEDMAPVGIHITDEGQPQFIFQGAG